jgi:phosphate uptake regulator
MILEASAVYWDKEQTEAEKKALYDKDVEVNRLQRLVRKKLVSHLSGTSSSDVPYGLLLMSLVKDIERLGDYAKNLAEVPAVAAGATLPDDPIRAQLIAIRTDVEELASQAAAVFSEADRHKAQALTVRGRQVTQRCDVVVRDVAKSTYTAGEATRAVLGARFYKRIEAHLLNLLSGILMPLHKLDYYDEDVLSESLRPPPAKPKAE